MPKILHRLKEAVEWGAAVWHVIGWLGLAALVTGMGASIGGAVWAVLTGIPIPIAIMAGYCTIVGAVYLGMAPMAYRALANPVEPKAAKKIKPDYKAWRQVQIISLNDAAALWCECDPHTKLTAPEIKTRLKVFFDAVQRDELPLVATGNADEYDMQYRRSSPEGWHSVTRDALKAFAKARGDDPEFLRDH